MDAAVSGYSRQMADGFAASVKELFETGEAFFPVDSSSTGMEDVLSGLFNQALLDSSLPQAIEFDDHPEQQPEYHEDHDHYRFDLAAGDHADAVSDSQLISPSRDDVELMQAENAAVAEQEEEEVMMQQEQQQQQQSHKAGTFQPVMLPGFDAGKIITV